MTSLKNNFGFAATNKTLCLYKRDAYSKAAWSAAKNGCAANGTSYIDAADNGYVWRLPNAAEMDNLHGKGTNIQSYEGNDSYWTLTETPGSALIHSDYAWAAMGAVDPTAPYFVRCARTMGE